MVKLLKIIKQNQIFWGFVHFVFQLNRDNDLKVEVVLRVFLAELFSSFKDNDFISMFH